MKLFNRLNKATMTFVFLLPLTPMVSFGQDTLTDGTVYYSSSFLNLEGLSTNEKILLIVSLLTLICIRSVHYFFFILPKRKKEIEAKRQRALQRERDKKSAEWRTKKQEIEKSIEKDRRKKLKISQNKIMGANVPK